MSETMKVAWIGLIGTLLGAVMGVIGATYFSDWLYGPREGIFSVDLTTITASNIDSTLREQITRYPGSLVVRHIDGPSVESITINIQSKYPLDSLNAIRNDENAEVTLSEDKRRLRIDIPRLRKGSSVQFDFLSLGTPELQKTVTMSSGQLADTLQPLATKPWYKTETFFITIYLLVLVLFLVLLFYLGRSLFSENGTLNLSKQRLRSIALILAALSILPLPTPFNLSDAFSIILLAVIYSKLEGQ